MLTISVNVSGDQERGHFFSLVFLRKSWKTEKKTKEEMDYSLQNCCLFNASSNLNEDLSMAASTFSFFSREIIASMILKQSSSFASPVQIRADKKWGLFQFCRCSHLKHLLDILQ